MNPEPPYTQHYAANPMQPAVYQQQAPIVYQAPKAPGDQQASASMALGIVALIFSLIPFVGVIAWPMSIAGIVLGIGAGKKGTPAPAGIVTNWLALAICTLWALPLVIIIIAAPFA